MRFHIVPVILAVAVAASAPAPASAQLIDLQEPIQLPDVRDLPIVRDVPIVQQLPDVRELPVVRDVTAPAPTPAPAVPSLSPTAVPQSTPAPTPAPASGGGTTAAGRTTTAGGSTAGAGATPGARSGAPDPAPAWTGASGEEPISTGTRRRPARRRSGDRPAGTSPVTRERRLRETVRELSGCLGALGPERRRVLVLRAGIGRPAPMSRRAVAQRLDATIVEVARSERRGIRDLRAAERAGQCGGPAAGQLGERSVPGAVGSGGAPTASDGDGAGGDVRVGAAGPEGRTGVKEEFRSSPPESPQTRVLQIASDPPPLAIVLGLAFLAGFAAVWSAQRRRRVA